MTNRRSFIKTLGGASVASAIPGFAKTNKNENTIKVGLIGVNSMGWADLNSFLKNAGTECIALCDVDRKLLEKRAKELASKTGKMPQLFGKHEEMLALKELQAVFIGTPDHWHCLQMADAVKAGKDVYVEKPIANSIHEANLMVKLARKHQRIVQVGQWQRSDPHWISALAFLKSGNLGKIRQVKAWADVNYGRGFDRVPDSVSPEGVDYNRWLGPAPLRSFNKNRFHGSFRYFWDYAGGLMTDWGVHMLDMVLAGMNVSDPVSVMAIGGKLAFPNDAAETPDTLTTVYDFGDFSFVWEHFMAMGTSPYFEEQGLPGVAFIGEKGILAINREKWKVIPQIENGEYLVSPIPEKRSYVNGLDEHTRNFLECIKSRKDPNCTIEMGRNAALIAHLGNLAYRTDKKIFWDKASQSTHISEADQLLRPEYRKPWSMPEE